MGQPKDDLGTLLHWVVIPLYGHPTYSSVETQMSLLEAGLSLILVDNNHADDAFVAPVHSGCSLIQNFNKGGIAGGFNCGVLAALEAGARIITLLDQDSCITPAGLQGLRELLESHPEESLVVGPRIRNQRRQQFAPGHADQLVPASWLDHQRTRFLISSGTTFAATQWPLLGSLDEELFIDFVDHAWCFRAQAAGFVLLTHLGVQLVQQFGDPHPNRICRWLGMELYSPQRHYYQLRNLRWLLHQKWVPLDLRCKELVKMLIKPWLWLVFEPKRQANYKAILNGMTVSLPISIGAVSDSR